MRRHISLRRRISLRLHTSLMIHTAMRPHASIMVWPAHSIGTAAICIKTIVTWIDSDIAAGDIDRQSFQSLAAFRNDDRAALDIKFSVAVNGIISRLDGQICCRKSEAVTYMYAVFRRCDGDRAPCDDQRVIRVYPVLIICCDRQTSAAVDRQVVVGENSTAGIVLQSIGGILRTACEGILRSFSQRQEHLVRLVYDQTGVITACHIHAIEPQPDFGRVIGLHCDAAVCQCAGQNIPAAVGDHNASVIGICAVSLDLSSIAGKCYIGRICVVAPRPVQIVGSEVSCTGVVFGIFIGDHLDSQLFTVHEYHGHKERQHKYDNTDLVDISVRRQVNFLLIPCNRRYSLPALRSARPADPPVR